MVQILLMGLAPASGVRAKSGQNPSGSVPKSGLACGSFLCIICPYWRHFGGGDGGYLDLAVGAGAGVRVGQAEVGPPP